MTPPLPAVFGSPPRAYGSHYDVLDIHHRKYEAGVRDGTIVPFTYPMSTYGIAIALLFFMIPPKHPLHSALTRYATFGAVLSWHVYMILNCRASNPSPAFGVGMISAWGILWSAVVLVFRDAKADWKRIESLEASKQREKLFVRSSQAKNKVVTRKAVGQNQSKPPLSKLFWQDYPMTDSLLERFDWVADLYSNFRGIGWNWKIHGLPSYPISVQEDLGIECPKETTIARNGLRRYDSYWSLMVHNMWMVTRGYMAADILKTIANHDPYFWGLIDAAPPSWLPLLIRNSSLLIRSYRLLVSMSFVWIGLRTIYCFAPLIFVGLFGPHYLGPRGEPWLYPDHFASYGNVFTRGLAGWWGAWWHQIFRFAFQDTATWLSNRLRISSHSLPGKTVSLATAFILSGALHASASMTQLGESHPWTGPFTFFALQPFGILAELLMASILQRTGIINLIPVPIRHVANFIWVHAWFLATGPLLTDDFARGGLWLFEPIMLSPLRGLGYGVPGDGWYCWSGTIAHWHGKGPFWLRGIAF